MLDEGIEYFIEPVDHIKGKPCGDPPVILFREFVKIDVQNYH
jgi:hypothetical protein